ncbi:MAG: transposase family protein [Acidobacteriota bacterium]|nr:transposase family protein [Acidobacteriota bacterium]
MPASLKEKPKLGDKAYVGAKISVETPTRKPKGGELTEEQKAANKQLAQGANLY